MNATETNAAVAHTPGPWKVSSRYGHNRTEVTNSGGGRAIATVWTHEGGHRSHDNQPVAYVPVPEGMANLRLIAAAPDLLTFAKHALARLQHGPDANPNDGLLSDALDLIARAEGR